MSCLQSFDKDVESNMSRDTRSRVEIEYARRVVNGNVINPDLSEQQKTLLAGMSVALQWACRDGGDALQRLLDGEPIAAGQTMPFPVFGATDETPPSERIKRAGVCIGVVGSRRRNSPDDYIACEDAVKAIYNEGDTFVSGGCSQGGDAFCERLAKQLQASITIHYAKWDLYGKRAGFIRNSTIAEDCDILIAVVASDRTGGTEDTIEKARKLGKEVIIVGEKQ